MDFHINIMRITKSEDMASMEQAIALYQSVPQSSLDWIIIIQRLLWHTLEMVLLSVQSKTVNV